MNKEALDKALNHICFKCPNLKTTDFKRCYCDVTKRRVAFREDATLYCPLLYIAYAELNAPCHDNETYIKKKNDDKIYYIRYSYFDIDNREYEYTCDELIGPHYFKSAIEKIKHSEITEIISSDDERVNPKYR